MSQPQANVPYAHASVFELILQTYYVSEKVAIVIRQAVWDGNLSQLHQTVLSVDRP